MIEYLGYFGALCIGLILGLTGAGGSILTVPILVYLMSINPVLATGYSLFVVGITSAFGTIRNIRDGAVEIKTALLYAIPSLTSIFLTRKFIVPAIPETIIQIGGIVLSKGSFLMLMFAIVMLAVAASMLAKKDSKLETDNRHLNILRSILRMLVLGVMIGMVGAGGGFLFIPVLLYVAKLPMKKAIATSLMIIALNSLIGFTGDLGNQTIDWPFLLGFTAVSVIGILIGIYTVKFINERLLKKGFAWFVVAMALIVLTREFLRL